MDDLSAFKRIAANIPGLRHRYDDVVNCDGNIYRLNISRWFKLCFNSFKFTYERYDDVQVAVNGLGIVLHSNHRYFIIPGFGFMPLAPLGGRP